MAIAPAPPAVRVRAVNWGLPVVSALAGAVAYLLLALALLSDRQSAPGVARQLLGAAGVSALWLLFQAFYYGGSQAQWGLNTVLMLEVLRDIAWILLLGTLLRGDGRRRERVRLAHRSIQVLAFLVLAAAVGLFGPRWLPVSLIPPPAAAKAGFSAMLGFAILGLVLVEQFYRNTPYERRWAIKYLCLGVGALFAYDFALYTDGVLFRQLDPALWTGRGIANALAVPLIAIAAARTREWKLNLFVSRQMVFHGTALLGVGIYLLAMAATGYYLKAYGGQWGSALRAVFLFAGLILLVVVLGSAELRARLRLFLVRHFYRGKYDHGEIWLRFTNLLSQSDTRPAELPQAILRAIADIMEATGGAMWQRNPTGAYGVVATHLTDPHRLHEIPGEDPLIALLREPEQIIDIPLEAARRSLATATALPGWLLEQPRAWLLVPIVHQDELLAFVMLCESRAEQDIVPEDRQLLGTLGRQAAGYLALMHATSELGDARQFEAFNRLSAFLVHDLKNVIAQLSMVIRNSERHRANPEFIQDAFNTIGDAVAKMNRMLGNLRQTQSGPAEAVSVRTCVDEAIAHLGARKPSPRVNNRMDHDARVRGIRDRVIAMIEHLVQNAQEATGTGGEVEVVLALEGSEVVVEVRDNGCGMSQEFVQHRLFRPFDTTKGKAGMGIGVYESLHVATAMGGRLTVESTPGVGTCFRIHLPRVVPEESAEAARTREKRA